MKKFRSVIGLLITSGALSGIAGGAVHFKYAKLAPALMIGSIVFVLLTSLGLSIINDKGETKK